MEAPLERALRRIEKQEDRRKESSDRDAIDEVFDKRTLLAAGRMVTRGLFTTVDFSISTGKVANVFRVSHEGGFRALKIYRVGNAVFRSIPPYLLHALREEVGANSFGRLVFAWARREFMALKNCHEQGLPVPEPIKQYRNLILMDFAGKDGLPFPQMIRCNLDDPERVMKNMTKAVRGMVTKVGLVHGDLSPYNVLLNGDRIILIDLGETIERDHPMAKQLLRRDAENFSKYFGRFGLDLSGEEMFDLMGGGTL